MDNQIIIKSEKLNDDRRDSAGQYEMEKDFLINEFIKRNCSGDGISLKTFVGDFEKEIIIKALNISRGNQRIASFILNINPTTLNEKIKRLNLRNNNKIKDQQDLKKLLSEVNTSLF